MAKINPAIGGVCYYGHSSDEGNDFTNAVNLIAGTFGHIQLITTSKDVVLRYDWMDTDHWICRTSEREGGYAYSVYQSNTGDVFAVFSASGSPYSAPQYTADTSSSQIWTYNNTTGTTGRMQTIYVFKFNMTDVAGNDEGVMFGIQSGNSGPQGICGYPSSLASPAVTGQGMSICATKNPGKFTILGPLACGVSSGVSTYARFTYQQEDGSPISAGAYTIAGYRFQMIACFSSSHPDSGCIALRNDAVS